MTETLLAWDEQHRELIVGRDDGMVSIGEHVSNPRLDDLAMPVVIPIQDDLQLYTYNDWGIADIRTVQLYTYKAPHGMSVHCGFDSIKKKWYVCSARPDYGFEMTFPTESLTVGTVLRMGNDSSDSWVWDGSVWKPT